MAVDPRGYDAFISHAKADAARAAQICEHLEAAGLRCWIAPRDVRASQPYGAEIMAGITASRCFVLVLSRACNLSDYVHRELERAVTYGKPVFSVRIEDVAPAASLELFVSAIQWIEAWSGRWSEHLDQLAGDVAAAGPGTSAPALDPASSAATHAATPAAPTRKPDASSRVWLLLVLLGVVLLAWWLVPGDDEAPMTQHLEADVPAQPGAQSVASEVSAQEAEGRSSAAPDEAGERPSEDSVPADLGGPWPPPAPTVTWELVSDEVLSSGGLHWRRAPIDGPRVDAERAVLELNRDLGGQEPRWRLPTLGELHALAALIDAGAVTHAAGDLLWSDEVASVTAQVLEYQPGGASTERTLQKQRHAACHLVRHAP